MAIRLYPPIDSPWLHWTAFYRYCCDELNDTIPVFVNANKLFKLFLPFLAEYNGKIIWPNGKEDSWSIECLEFETEEDLVIFKLKFN